MSANRLRRIVAALGMAVGLSVALLLRPIPFLVAPVDTPYVSAGSEYAAPRTGSSANTLFRIQAAQALAELRETAARPVAQASMGQAVALLMAISGLAMGLAGLIALRLAALNRTQQTLVAHANDAGLNSRRLETRARLSDVAAIEIIAAQLAADTLSRPLRLREGYLVADALPTPFFSITDDAGDRYFFTTDPGLFRRARIVRPSDLSYKVSALSISARADMLAAWEALSALKGLSHIAVPCRADWHLIVYRPFREQTPLWQRLRTAQSAWRLTRSQPEAPQMRSAGLGLPVTEEGAL